MARWKRDENVVKLASELLKNNAKDLQEGLREVMGTPIETTLEGELTEH